MATFVCRARNGVRQTPMQRRILSNRAAFRIVCAVAAAAIVPPLAGCQSPAKDVRSEPLLVPAKQPLFSSWEAQRSPETTRDATGSPFTFDGKAREH